MTMEEQKLWGIIVSLRKAFAEMAIEQRKEIGTLVDKAGEKDRNFKLLISSLLELISQRDLWDVLLKSDLKQNIQKLRNVKIAITKGIIFNMKYSIIITRF